MTEFLPQESNEKSLWVETALAAPVCDALQSTVNADVLVVGGGFTGLSSALYLAEQGARVVLLEAGSIGFGGSGRNAGLVNAGVWKTPEHVVKVLGQAAGSRFNQALYDSPRQVFELVERLGMQCQAQACGTVHMAHSLGGMAYLRDRCRQLQALGAQVELLDGDGSQAISGSPAYCHGGILDRRAGTIQPLSYARELARCAIEKGVAIHPLSALRKLAQDGNRWLASTDCGQVRAEQVILATNAYAQDNDHGVRDVHGVRDSTVPVYIFHFATAPLAEELRASLMPGRHGLWDTHTLLTSSRIDADGRLVMSFPGRLRAGQRPMRKAWATRRRDYLYPQLRGTDWAYFWTGRIGVTTDNLLRVQKLAPGLYAPAGYNGRGIGTGTVMGKQLAGLLGGDAADNFAFPVVPLYREPLRAARAAYYNFGTLALQLVSQRFQPPAK